MWNLIKAQHYQLRNDKVIRWIWILFLGSQVWTYWVKVQDVSLGEMTGSYSCVGDAFELVIVLSIFVVSVTARVMGRDYKDKTMNYELMAGHSRSDVLLSRLIVSLLHSAVGCILCLFLPMVFFTVINGWGNSTDFGNVILLYVVSFLPLFRIWGECVLLTMLLKHDYMAMIIGTVLFYGSMLIVLLTKIFVDFEFILQFSCSNLNKLLSIDNGRMHYVNSEDVWVYESAAGPELMIGTIVVSLIAGVVCLLLGYLYFKKSDMN